MITTEIIAFATANELCGAFSSPPVSPERHVSKSIGGAGTVEYMYSWIIVIFNHVVNHWTGVLPPLPQRSRRGFEILC